MTCTHRCCVMQTQDRVHLNRSFSMQCLRLMVERFSETDAWHPRPTPPPPSPPPLRSSHAPTRGLARITRGEGRVRASSEARVSSCQLPKGLERGCPGSPTETTLMSLEKAFPDSVECVMNESRRRPRDRLRRWLPCVRSFHPQVDKRSRGGGGSAACPAVVRRG